MITKIIHECRTRKGMAKWARDVQAAKALEDSISPPIIPKELTLTIIYKKKPTPYTVHSSDTFGSLKKEFLEDQGLDPFQGFSGVSFWQYRGRI
jgi:hypothetical protein